MSKSAPSSPDQLAARDRMMLAIMADHVGKVLPSARNMAAMMGCTKAQSDHAMRRLRRTGAVELFGNGPGRVYHIVGVGSTLPEYPGKEVAAYTERAPEPEPVRVFNFACPRCGTRNCARHSPVPLITRAAAAMVLV